jgi:hypothetical protein
MFGLRKWRYMELLVAGDRRIGNDEPLRDVDGTGAAGDVRGIRIGWGAVYAVRHHLGFGDKIHRI